MSAVPKEVEFPEGEGLGKKRERKRRRSQVAEAPAAYIPRSPHPLSSPPIAARLLELEEAARYLGVSPWTVRDLEAAGTIQRVRVPLPGRRELRKLLFDKTELDRLIDTWKA